jgi:hypothetical protein
MTDTQNTRRYGNTAAYIVAAVAVVLGLAVSAWLSTSAPSPQPKQPQLSHSSFDASEAKQWGGSDEQRKAMPQTIKNTMRENGCRDCSAAARGTILEIVAPNDAPKEVADTWLTNDAMVTKLKDAGFTMLEVKQSRWRGSSFQYPIP